VALSFPHADKTNKVATVSATDEDLLKRVWRKAWLKANNDAAERWIERGMLNLLETDKN
jgi:hypothetical protein